MMMPPAALLPHPVADRFSPGPANWADPGRERPPGGKPVAKQSCGEPHNPAVQGSLGGRKAPRSAAAMRDIAAPVAYGPHGNDPVAPPTPRAMRTDLPPSGDPRGFDCYPLLPNYNFPHPPLPT